MDRAYSSVIGAPPTITFTRSRSPAFSIASITVFIAVTILGCPLPRGHPLTSKSQPRPSSPSWRLQCVGHHRQFRHTPSREGYAREQWSLRQPPDAGAARAPPAQVAPGACSVSASPPLRARLKWSSWQTSAASEAASAFGVNRRVVHLEMVIERRLVSLSQLLAMHLDIGR